MAILAVDRFGRVVIPKALRERLGWRPGTALECEVDDHGLHVHLAPQPKPEPARGLMLAEDRLVYDASLPPSGEDPIVSVLAAERASRELDLGAL